MKKGLRISAIVAGVLVGFILLALCAVSLILTPERLTRLVREYGTEYLVDGCVDVKSVDMSIWSTFPHAVLTIDSLNITNRRIPAEYRSVINVERIEGRINLAALLIGRISIKHAEIVRPDITLWVGADSTQTSLSILPEGDNSDDTDEESPLSLPDIRLTNFRIDGNGIVRYISERDSLDLCLTLQRINLDGNDTAPQYRLLTSANVKALPWLHMPLDIILDGGIGWQPSEPLSFSLHDFIAEIDKITTRTSLKADLSDGIRLDELEFELLPLPLQRLSELADSMTLLAAKIPAIKTDGTISLKAKLSSPYTYSPDTLRLPDMTVEARIKDSAVDVPAYYLTLTNFGAELSARISSEGPDYSEVELKRLNIKFPATDLTLTGSATNMASDPAINGCVKGMIDFTNLNRRLWTLLGMRFGGSAEADVNIKAHLSDLTPNTFHRIKLNGEASLNNFTALLPADTIYAGATHAKLRFGSADTFHGVDSLLMATLKADSLWANLPDLDIRLKDLTLGAGVSNTASTTDTTTVTPMGGRLTVKSLKYRSSADSTRALIRELSGGISLSRFKGNNRAPQLAANLAAKRLVYADGVNRASLRGLDIAASAHISPRKGRTPRKFSRADSMRMAARRDSILLSQSGFERVDVGIDRKAVQLLKRLNVSGHVRADGGRVITPLFPLRTRMKGLNMTFCADSVKLNALKLTAGSSDFSLQGSITNIQRALGRRAATQPLRLRLDINSDSININQLTQAAFRGAAFASQADSLKGVSASIELDDETMEADADAAASAETMAIVVPMNIDAVLSLHANHILYSTLELKDLGGEILIANGAANLRDLHASTDIGSADLNMLYYAPTRRDVNFGLGLDLHRFNIGRVTELMPALDSIMPILNSLGGIIDVSVSATTPVDSAMNIRLPELSAMVRLSGDSLRVLDEKTFKTVSKWLLFHDKNKNMIDHMDVHLAVDNNQLSLYPFMFDFDRYRIGVMGSNDLALNLDYHVSILKSPIPFKFGINVKGSADKMKIRLGRARFKENMAAQTRQLSDTVRLNLANEIRDVFARGAKAARLGPLTLRKPRPLDSIPETTDTLTAADSLYFRQQGLTL